MTIRSMFLMTLFVVLIGGFNASAFVGDGTSPLPPASPVTEIYIERLASLPPDRLTLFTCFEGPGPMPTPTNPPSGVFMK